MKMKYALLMVALLLTILLSSCMIIGAGQQAPVRLLWKFTNPGITDAYFAYDSTTDLLFLRGDHAATAGIMAVDISDKKILWEKTYPGQSGPNQCIGTYDGKVFLLEDRIFPPTVPGLVALDEETGDQVWKLPFEKSGVYNGLTVYKGYIYTFGGGHYESTYIYKVDAETGKVVWKAPIQGAFDTRPVIDEKYGCVDFGTSIDPDNRKDPEYFYAMDMNTGNVVWKTTIQPTGWADDFETIPVIYGDSVYAGTWFGKIVRFNRQTGQIIWQTRLMDTKDGYAYEPGWGGKFYIYDGNLEMVLTSGIIIALNTKDGTVVWQKNAVNDVDGLMDMYLNDGKIYVHGWGQTIGCFSAENGDELWLYTPPSTPGAEGRIVGAPMVIGNYLVDANCGGDFYLMSLEIQ